MSVNPLVGKVYPPTEPYEVGREQIRLFAEAVNDDSPIYHSAEAARALGYPNVIAPPTFAVVFTFRATQQVIDDADFDIDYDRVVHGAQRFEYHRPIHAGEQLTCTVVVDSIKNFAGHRSITLRTEVRTTVGEHVLTDWSTLVVRAAAVGSA